MVPRTLVPVAPPELLAPLELNPPELPVPELPPLELAVPELPPLELVPCPPPASGHTPRKHESVPPPDELLLQAELPTTIATAANPN
jgi:hypothetical protein